MRFEGKVAMISGGGAGMGRAAARGFAREGACVVISDINEQNLESAAAEIRAAGGTVTAMRGDVTNRVDIRAAVARAIEDYGKVDILFNYAGGEPGNVFPQPFLAQTEDYWERTIELNLMSTIVFSRAVLDSMAARKYGKIINTSAVAGLIGAGMVIPYSAAKGGIIAFTKALAREMAPYNININCVCPGPIETPGSARMSPKDISEEEKAAMMEKSLEQIPLRRIGRPEEVASAVLYLASDEAAFITGQALAIDGGMSMV